MSRVTLVLALAACNLRPYDFDATATDTSTTTTTANTTLDPTTLAPTTSTDTTSTSSSTSVTGSTGVQFILPLDSLVHENCDQWTENCPEGQKCMPVSLDGDNSWESLLCVPVVPNPDQPGDPCTIRGTGLDGLDTCDKHAICWNVDADTKMGTCVAMCTGTAQDPDCADPAQACAIAADAVLTICFPSCDPIEQDCPNMDLCIPNPQGVAGFVCVLDASGVEGQPWDPCGYANACDPGAFCNDPALAPGYCDDESGDGCCIPFCDLSAPNCPPSPMGMPPMMVECLAYFTPGMEPPGLDHVGYCGLPMP